MNEDEGLFGSVPERTNEEGLTESKQEGFHMHEVKEIKLKKASQSRLAGDDGDLLAHGRN